MSFFSFIATWGGKKALTSQPERVDGETLLEELKNPEARERVFKIFREYIQHEDNLINQRMTWMMTTQSFLLVFFGLGFKAKYDYVVEFSKSENIASLQGRVSPIPGEIGSVLLAIAIFGFFTCLMSYISIDAARRAVRALNGDWHKLQGAIGTSGYLPGIIGGGRRNAVLFGWITSHTPLLVAGLWLAIFFIAHLWAPMAPGGWS